MLKKLLSTKGRFLISGAPEGGDAMILGDAAHQAPGRLLLHIARDDARMARLAEAINFFHPEIDCLQFPAWDCLPYDRVSPNGTIVSQRMEVLSRLAHSGSTSGPAGGGDRLVITTVNAVLQRTPPRESLNGARLEITRSGRMPLDSLVGFLERHGYIRSGTVTEPGDYAPRGGLVDIFPPGAAAPLRIDLFGDQVDSIRVFDPLTQRSAESVERLMLTMVTEFRLDEETVARFREGYRELFGAMTGDDPLYEAVCAGRRHIGMEHWLPLFHDRMETLFDYVGGAPVSLDPLLDNARESRLSAIADYYGTRRQAASRAKELVEGVYRPLPPERLYLDEAEWAAYLAPRAVAEITPFDAPGSDATPLFDAGGRPSRDFAAERADPDANLFDAVGGYIERELGRGRRLLVACYSEGSLDRLAGLLADHGVEQVARPDGWAASRDLPQGAAALVVLGLDHGFETDALVVLSEQDILGDRLARRQRRARRVEDFIAEASQLQLGDIVVHIDHGIGRFDGLETIELSGARHDCLRLYYDGDDKLYLPVENIEALSRYGSSDSVVQLDRLGGLQWQARKARLKERIKEMAGELLRVAAERRLRPGEKMAPPEGLYDEFCARFPYMETEDQSRSIEDVIGDLASGRPMDRLICGDVGFGKTEVAMRAAFIAVMEGWQVAVVVPTTLLCRQHFATFSERFQGLPVRIAQLSRLVAGKRAVEVKQGMANGQVDIVIGTHALLGKSIAFKRLGLLVIDEEQHFGVAHKERLKQMRADVHVLTLTATPIPRTMQMALTGVRELSLMATPPVDRLAVRSFIMPYDPVVVREAILREHFRGGQSFFVCPRIEDIGPAAARLAELVPEVRIATAHGRLASRHLENVMTAFYDRAYDVLISTAIIESGLDIPSVNTMIVYHAHMFGLSQLYQLRGRIGRSKLRAYAYFTLPPHGGLTNAATKRLEVLHKLDSLGAGFSLASHDLDIRGAGNLLGSEQSGHIREVGLELFQHMLEEAVRVARAAGEGGEGTEKGVAEPTVKDWTPQINVGAAVLIPEEYVADLGVRLALYRRLALLESGVEVDAFAAELIDRFGPLPVLVENLLEVMTIKRLCRDAGVARVEAGDTGAVLSFHDDHFANPAGLAAFIGRQSAGVRLRPDHSLLIPGDWAQAEARLKGVRGILASIAEIAKDAG